MSWVWSIMLCLSFVGVIVFTLIYREPIIALFLSLIAVMSFMAEVMEMHIEEKLKKYCEARCSERGGCL